MNSTSRYEITTTKWITQNGEKHFTLIEVPLIKMKNALDGKKFFIKKLV